MRNVSDTNFVIISMKYFFIKVSGSIFPDVNLVRLI